MSATHETSLPLDKPEPRLADKLVFPEDARWEQARQAWNLAVDQQPAAVGLPESVEDVIAMIAFATERGLRVAPQSTGHAAGALLLKTSSIRGVRIDPDARTARAQAGALWTDVTAAAAPHGLAALAGSAADVGVVGYTLGGGVSWSGRRYGLACNSVTAVELVTAHGAHIRADLRTRTGPVLGVARRRRQLRCGDRARVRASHPRQIARPFVRGRRGGVRRHSDVGS